MHGLKTYQSASYGPTYVQDVGSGAPTIKVYNFYTVDSPNDLAGGLFNGELATSTTEFWVKRYYNIYHFVNTLPVGCMMTVTRFRCRNSLPKNATFVGVSEAMEDLMNDTNAVATLRAPFISNLTSPTLHKWMKITSHKTFVMKPGKIYKIRQKIQSRYINRPLQRIAEGGTNDYVLMRGSEVVLVEFNGIPVYNNAMSGTTDTTLGPLRVVSVNKFYASFYRMDESNDENEVFAYLPSTQNATLAGIGIPSMYTQIRPQAETGAHEPHSLVATGADLNGELQYMGTNTSFPFHVIGVL